METRHPTFLGAEGRQGWGMQGGQPQDDQPGSRDVAGMRHPWTAVLGEKPNSAGCCLGREMVLLHPQPPPPFPC